MARRSNNIEVAIVGDADFKSARREASRAFDQMENDAREVGESLSAAGEEGADGIASALGGIDFKNIGATGLDSLTGALSAAGPWAAAAGAIAVVFGDELIQGFEQAFGRRKNNIMRAIRTGASDAELATAGQAAGEAWSAGFGDSLQDVTATADELVRTLGDIVPEADLAEATKQAQVLSDVLGVDVAEAARLAGRLVKQDLADNWEDAFDDMVGVTQEFGDTGREALDILEEFGGNFARFEVDAGQALNFVASAFQDGLVPTIDRAGEAFEEFQTRITDADSREAIEELGLSFDALQDAVAKGGPAANAAMQEVIGALLDLEDQSELTAKANIIFGQSFEQVEDPAALLELALAALRGELDDYAGASEDAADAMEASITQMEKLERRAVDLGGILGNMASSELNKVVDGFDMIWDAGSRAVDQLKFWEDSASDVSDGSDEMAESIRFAAIEAGVMADEAGELTDALDQAEGGVRDLRGELELLKGFGGDQVLRGIADATDSVVESLDQGAASAIGLNGQIDITTEEGRRLQGQLERVSFALVDAKEKMDNGELSAYDFASAQAQAEADLRRAAAAAGLGAAETQGLIDKYLTLIGLGDIEKKVVIDFDGSFALNEMERFLRLAPQVSGASAKGRASVSYSSSSSSRRSTSTRSRTPVNVRAAGGPTRGLTLVGEEGPELVDFGSAEAFVHNTADTRRIVGAAASSMAGGGRNGAMTQPVVIRIDSAGSRLDDLLVELLRKAISNRGGSVQAVLG